MTDAHRASLNKAFELKEKKKFKKAIKQFQKTIKKYGKTPGALGMIAALYYYRLDNAEMGAKFAKETIELSPTSEMASITLVHSLIDLKRNEEADAEIARYVKAGGKIDLYNALFEENGLTVEDFR